MGDPRVVAADQHSVTYENGAVVPRDLPWANEHAAAFEGQQAMPQAPMGGYDAGPQTADAGDLLRTDAGRLQQFNEGQQRVERVAPPASDGFVGGAGFNGPDATADARPAQPSMTGLAATARPVADNRVADTRPYTEPTPTTVGWVNPQQAPSSGQAYSGGGGGSRRVSTTTQTESGTPVDPAILSDVAYQGARAEQAQSDIAQNQGDLARNQERLASETVTNAQRIEDARVAHERERRKAADIAESDYRTAVADFSAKTVDPAKWYHDRGTGGTIMAAIAMGLGAFGQTLTGGPNTAMQIIQDSINADIDAQKENIANAGKGLAAQHGILADMRERFSDERMAETAARAAMLENARMKAEQMEASARASGAEPAGELVSANLAIEGDKLRAQLGQIGAENTSTQRTVASSSGGGGAARRRAGEPVTYEIPGTVVTNPERVMSLRPGDRAALAQGVAGLMDLRSGIQEALRLRTEHGRTVPYSTADEEGSALQGRLVTSLSLISNAGTINGGERIDYRDQLPHPGALRPNVEARLTALLNTVERNMGNTLYVNGYAPAEGGPATGGARPSTARGVGE